MTPSVVGTIVRAHSTSVPGSSPDRTSVRADPRSRGASPLAGKPPEGAHRGDRADDPPRGHDRQLSPGDAREAVLGGNASSSASNSGLTGSTSAARWRPSGSEELSTKTPEASSNGRTSTLVRGGAAFSEGMAALTANPRVQNALAPTPRARSAPGSAATGSATPKAIRPSATSTAERTKPTTTDVAARAAR